MTVMRPIVADAILKEIYDGVSIKQMAREGKVGVSSMSTIHLYVKSLEGAGLVKKKPDGMWEITPKGISYLTSSGYIRGK